MAIEIWEKFDSPHTTDRVGGVGSSAEFSYILQGSNDEEDLRTALRAHVSATYLNLVLQDIKIDSQLAPDLWKGQAKYGDPDDSRTQEPPETGDVLLNFDITGATEHISQSLGTRNAYAVPPAGIFFNHQGAINATNEGVEGIDIVVPKLQFGETHYLPNTAVTQAYLHILMELSGRTNDGPFRGFAQGELLFLGARGQRRGRGDWEVSFTWAAEGNKILSIAGVNNVDKRGHEYLWVSYEDSVDQNILGKIARSIYVEKVYEEGDFNDLGI